MTIEAAVAIFQMQKFEPKELSLNWYLQTLLIKALVVQQVDSGISRNCKGFKRSRFWWRCCKKTFLRALVKGTGAVGPRVLDRPTISIYLGQDDDLRTTYAV